ncbi:unnamed protein product [Oppiella nova]|uniref:Uncharacterized protein n=1 Tax=Oppiella nova TaxID=334625 RepID=A0A7R9M4U5_9ACAR|nr:unnamed protein product [Oppiella nova]CAG2170545.1 unnamed protein product [Oppiella nova]
MVAKTDEQMTSLIDEDIGSPLIRGSGDRIHTTADQSRHLSEATIYLMITFIRVLAMNCSQRYEDAINLPPFWTSGPFWFECNVWDNNVNDLAIDMPYLRRGMKDLDIALD